MGKFPVSFFFSFWSFTWSFESNSYLFPVISTPYPLTYILDERSINIQGVKTSKIDRAIWVQRGTHPWLLPCHIVPRSFSEWCSQSLMIFQVSKLPLFHCLFPGWGNAVNLIAFQLPVVLVFISLFNDPVSSLCRKDLSHFWRVPPLSVGRSAIPAALDKAAHTSFKTFCLAIRRAKISVTCTFLHHIMPNTSTQDPSQYYILYLQKMRVKTIPILFLPWVIKERRIHHL